MAKTPAQRMREYRERIRLSSDPPSVKKALIRAYELGYADAMARRAPRPQRSASESLAYIAGGLDAQ